MVKVVLFFSLFGVAMLMRAKCDGAEPRPIPASIEDVCKYYPDHVRAMFDAIDLDIAGLEDTKTACQDGRLCDACRVILGFYRKSPSGAWLRRRQPHASDDHDTRGDAVCADRLTFYEQTDVVPRRPNGRLQWDYTGPAHDREWALALNTVISTCKRCWTPTSGPATASISGSSTNHCAIGSPRVGLIRKRQAVQ